MEHFIINWDSRINNPVEPIGLSKELNKDVLQDINEVKRLSNKMLHFYLNDKPGNLYVDFINNTISLVSQNLKNMLGKFEPSIIFIPSVLVDLRSMQQETYWGMVPKSFDCLSDKSEFNKNNTIKRIVIDSKKVVNAPRVFKVAGIMEDITIIDLCTAEAILRRDFIGVNLQKVDKFL